MQFSLDPSDIPKGFSITAETDRASYSARIIAGDDSESLHFSHESLKVDQIDILGRGPNGTKIHKPRPGIDVNFAIAPEPEASRGMYDSYRNWIGIADESRAELDRFASYVIYAPQTAVLRGTAIDSRNVKPLGLTGGRLAAAAE